MLLADIHSLATFECAEADAMGLLRVCAGGALFVLAALLAAAACSKTEPTATPTLVVACDALTLTVVGQQVPCRARVGDQDRTEASLWSSSDPTKITVNAAGLVTSVAIGTVDIVARYQGQAATQSITFAIPCLFAIQPPSFSAPSTGGSQAVAVTVTPADCSPKSWTASSNNAGLTLNPSGGTGNGTVTVTVGANTGAAQTWTATIAGQTFSANIGAVQCSYSFSATSPDSGGNRWSVSTAAGDRTVAVSVTPTSSACAAWTATSADNWITVSPASGTSSAQVKLSFTDNGGPARTGSVTFTPPGCGQPCNTSFTAFLDQAGAGPSSFTLNLTLAQGQTLSGPYGGIATGPNGFSCTLSTAQQSVDCAPAVFAAGTTVQLTVVLSPDLFGDTPIFSTTGCNSATSNSCTVVMNADKNVTIRVGRAF